MKTAVTVSGFITFLLMGMTVGGYGSALPVLRDDYNLSAGAAGFVVTTHFIGALAATFVFATLARKTHLKTRFISAGILLCLGTFGFAASDSWLLVLGSSLSIGLGYGAAGAAYNAAFAVGFGERSTTMLALINGLHGVGALLGPAFIGLVGAENLQNVYLTIGALGVIPLLLVLFSSVVDPRIGTEVANGKNRSIFPLHFFVVMMVMGVAIEAACGAWISTYLQDEGVSKQTGSFVAASFWAALAFGRLTMGPVVTKWGEQRLILFSFIGLIPMLALALQGQSGIVVFAIIGLLLAPLFPCVMAWAGHSSANPERAGTIVFASALIGGGIGPIIVGRAIDATGNGALPIVTILFSACGLLAFRKLQTAKSTLSSVPSINS